MPAEIDQLERRATSLEIERQALKREDDPNSRERLAAVERELAEMREQANALEARWQKEKRSDRPHPRAQGADRAAEA